MHRSFLISKLWYLLILLICSNPLRGQQTKILTYEEAINTSLKKSYTVKSFLLNKLAMQHNFEFRKAMFKPRLDFSTFMPSWNEQVFPIEVSDGLPVYNSTGSIQYGGKIRFTYILPSGGNFALSSTMYRENLKRVLTLQDYEKIETNQAYTSLSLSFSQPIFTTNTLKQDLNEAKYEFDLSSSRFSRGQMDIYYNVTEGFYKLYRATRQVGIDEERLRNAKEAYRIAKLKGEMGRIPEAEVLIAKVTAAQAEASLSESVGALESEKDTFKQLIGLPLTEDLQITTNLEYDTFAIDLDKAIEEALKNRLEISEKQLNIELQRIEVDRARRVREFKGNIYAYYDITGVSTSGSKNTFDLFNSSFENFTERPPNRGINFTFSFPISDWGRGVARVQQAAANLEEAEFSLENQKIQVVKEVREVVRRVKEALNRLKINEEAQELAKHSYEISLMQFENGDITSQELGREQERLATTQIDYLNAFVAYQLAVADLKRKTMWDFKYNRSYMEEMSLVDGQWDFVSNIFVN